ncbi:hypothetical protein SDC9_164448 [bioreactor metagenome]|uniref:Uncharacterized protein n=1 Tax=bioreactor metagenome TaxID=1076179 RepID=A0A645FRM0_9ZZZZ
MLTVVHLGVELKGKGFLSLHPVCSVFYIPCRGDWYCSLRQFCNGITVGHPHLGFGGNSHKQGARGVVQFEGSSAILSGQGRVNLPTVMVGQVLCPIANSQQRQIAFYSGKINNGGILIPYRKGAARQDNPFYLFSNKRNLIERNNLTININLSQSPANKLGKLGSEVQDQDFFGHGQLFSYF